MFVSATTAPNTTRHQPITPTTRAATGSSCFKLDGAVSTYSSRLLDMDAFSLDILASARLSASPPALRGRGLGWGGVSRVRRPRPIALPRNARGAAVGDRHPHGLLPV